MRRGIGSAMLFAVAWPRCGPGGLARLVGQRCDPGRPGLCDHHGAAAGGAAAAGTPVPRAAGQSAGLPFRVGCYAALLALIPATVAVEQFATTPPRGVADLRVYLLIAGRSGRAPWGRRDLPPGHHGAVRGGHPLDDLAAVAGCPGHARRRHRCGHRPSVSSCTRWHRLDEQGCHQPVAAGIRYRSARAARVAAAALRPGGGCGHSRPALHRIEQLTRASGRQDPPGHGGGAPHQPGRRVPWSSTFWAPARPR